MSNLIRIKQINTAELSGYLSQIINEGELPLFATITGADLVYLTGNQIISGTKIFKTRPQVDGSGVLVQGEAVDLNTNQSVLGLKNFSTRPQVGGVGVALVGEALPDVPSGFLVLTTGDQTISGIKTFKTRPQVDGTGILLVGEATAGNLTNVVFQTGNQTISGLKIFAQRPQVDGSGVSLSNELVASGNKLAYDIQILSGDAVLDFGNQTISGNKTFKSRPDLDGTGLATTGAFTVDKRYIYLSGSSTPITSILNGDSYITDTRVFSFSFNLPASPTTGFYLNFVDGYDTWGIRNFVLNQNGQRIEGLNEPFTGDVAGYEIKCVFVGGPAAANTGWKIV